MFKLVLALSSMFLALPTFALEKPTAIVDGVRYRFQSKVLDEKASLDIYLPEHFQVNSKAHSYPVMVVMEQRFVKVVAGTIAHLTASERLPEMIVVGFTTDSGKYFGPNLHANGMWGPNFKQLIFDGEAAQLSLFFKTELFPYLEEQFQAAPYRMILGSSARAAYPLHTFWKDPNLFQVHMAIAAGDILGMGYQEGSSLIDHLAAFLAENPKHRGNLYVASADGDAEDPATKANLLAIGERLAARQHAGLSIKGEILSNQVHYDALLPGLLSALEMTFPKKKWSRDFREFEAEPGDLLANIDAHFKNLSTEYGFPILPPAVKWNSGSCLEGTGRRLLRAGNKATAIRIYERWVLYQPKSARAKHKLAKALEADGQFQRAIEMQTASLALLEGDKASQQAYLETLKSAAKQK